METIYLIVFFLVVLSPLGIMYFLHRKRSPKEVQEYKEKGERDFSKFEAALMLMSIGASIFPSLADVPFWLRAVVFLFGLALLVSPNKDLKNLKPFSYFLRNK